jgi:hypothetical protein
LFLIFKKRERRNLQLLNHPCLVGQEVADSEGNHTNVKQLIKLSELKGRTQEQGGKDEKKRQIDPFSTQTPVQKMQIH